MSCVNYRELGFGKDGGKSGTIKVIDPNCFDGNQSTTVDHEDLNIFVSLKTNTKGKSLIDGSKATETKKTTSFQFLSPKKPNGTSKEFLTTDWTEIGGLFDESNLGADFESFGITNIDIDVNASHVPQITIDFTDIRGATLFEQGSCSKYAVFFHLPYPVFELEIKGFYGKPIKWYLNLVKFNTKFNSETGNFESRAEFVGWSYAFLADMAMGYGMAAPYMGQFGAKDKLQKLYKNVQLYYEKLFGDSNSPEYIEFLNTTTISDDTFSSGETIFCNNDECLTIMKLLQKLKGLENNLNEVGKTKELDRVTKLLTLKELMIRLKNSVSDFRRELITEFGWKLSSISEKDSNGDDIGDTDSRYAIIQNNNAPSISFTANAPSFSLYTKEVESSIKSFFGDNGKIPNLIKQILQFELGEGKTAQSILSNDRILLNSDAFGKLFTESADGEGEDGALSVLKKNTIFQRNVLDGLTGENSPSGYHVSEVEDHGNYIAIGMLQEIIQEQINGVTKKINKEKENIGDAINEVVRETLGFIPTIKNIFIILTTNIELFNHLLLDATVAAEKLHNDPLSVDASNVGNKVSDGLKANVSNNTTKIWPWPTYINTDNPTKEKGSLEVFPGDDHPEWKEVEFVNDFLNSLLRLRKDIDSLSDDYAGKPGFDNYAPINPVETPLSLDGLPLKYKGIDESDEGASKLYRTIGERALLTLDYTYFNPLYLSEESLHIPTYANVEDSSWTPLAGTEDGVKEFVRKLGTFDAYNLVNSVENQKTLENLEVIVNESDDTFFKLINESLQGKGNVHGTSKDAKYTDIRENSLLTTDAFTEKTSIDSNTTFFSYKPKNGYIVMGDESGVNNSLRVYPNINDVSKEEIKNVFRIFKPNEVKNARVINISSDDQGDKFEEGLDEHVTNVNKNISINKEYRAIVDLQNGKELSLHTTQKTPLFSGGRLFIGLKPGGNKKNDGEDEEVDETTPDFSNQFSNIESGDVLYPNFITNRLGNPDGFNITTHKSSVLGPSYGGPPIQFFKDPNKGWEDLKFDWTSGKGDDPIDYLESLGDGDVEVMNTLVQLPLWLDNVNKFRNEPLRVPNTEINGIKADDIEKMNLAYLFLDNLQGSPLISVTQGDKATDRKSFSKGLIAFNIMGSLVNVPKAWLLNFGSKLWRYKSFVGVNSGSGSTWNKISEGNTPNGLDPLVQPGYPITSTNLDSDGKLVDFYKNDSRTNQRLDDYLTSNMLLNGVNTTNFQTSTFSENILKEKRSSNLDWSDADSCYFDYYGYYSKGHSTNTQFVTKDGDIPKGVDLNGEINGLFDDDLITLGILGTVNDEVDTRALGKSGGGDKLKNTLDGYPSTITTISKSVFLEKTIWKTKWAAPWEWGFYLEPASTTHTVFGYTYFENLKVQYQTLPTYGSGPIYEYKSFLPKEYSYDLSDGDLLESTDDATTVQVTKESTGSFGWVIERIPDHIKNVIIDNFRDWALGEFNNELLGELDPINFGDDKVKELSDSYEVKEKNPPTPFSEGEHGQNRLVPKEILFKRIKNLLTDKYTLMNSTPKTWWATKDDDIKEEYRGTFNVNKVYLDEYIIGLKEELKSALKTRLVALSKETSETKQNLGNLFGDDDVKLSLYRGFKSLNDKWISSSVGSENKLFFNLDDADCIKSKNDIDKTTLPLAAHFSFVNRTMGDVGNRAIIDISVLRDMVENPTMSFYQLIDRIMKENHFNFFPLPSFSNFSNANIFSTGTSDKKLEEQLKGMFEPATTWECVESGPQFICMYVGGTSRVLDFNTKSNCSIDTTELNNVNDSLKLIDDDGQLNTDWANTDLASEDTNVTLFRVAYGHETQSHFKSIQLDQSEFTETQESLTIIDALAKGGDPSKHTSKGQNLHNLYLTRSYSCTVEAMGNMMIQPTMYFQLDNVPMFNGLYMILQVSHSVQPNTVSTTFKGVRQPLSTVPIITDAVTSMNIDIGDLVSGVEEEDRGTTTLNGGTSGGNIKQIGLNYSDFHPVKDVDSGDSSDPYDDDGVKPQEDVGDDTLFEFQQIDV